MKVYSFAKQLDIVTGIQKVLLDIHNGIKDEYDAKIVGFQNFKEINRGLNISSNEYIQLKRPFLLKKSILIVHERKMATFFVSVNVIFGLKMKIIYVHHSLFSNLRFATFLPKNIVSISDRVTENLVSYFKIPRKYITKIHNGILDRSGEKRKYEIKDKIKILYPGRINDGKRQIEIVKKLQGKISDKIQILFAGTGANYDELCILTQNDTQFISLGFIEDMIPLIESCDYILLFSIKEGLPISLIEGTMCSTPLITNDVGGNLEIAIPGKNSYLVSSWEELINQLNALVDVDENTYTRMSKESRLIYEEKFKYSVMIDKYKSLIQKVYKGGSRIHD